jgi:hypothetical protein
MAKFTYNGDQERIYPFTVDISTGRSLVAEPGQSYDLDAAPDDQWSASDASVKAPQSTPEAPVAPAEPAPDQTPSN